jgi:uncharacterized protein
MKKEIDVNEVAAFLDTCGPNTKVYIGADSERFQIDGNWYADYILAVVIHIDGCHGCKIFGAVQRERDFEQKKNRPRMRLMMEVYKVADLYLKLYEAIPHDIEVHLDINPNEMYGSSCVLNEAIGYIKGMCNVVPIVEPKAWCASYAADRFKSLVA